MKLSGTGARPPEKTEQDRIAETVLRLTAFSLWHNGQPPDADEAVFEEMKRQAVVVLPLDFLGEIQMPDSLRGVWRNVAVQKVSFFYRCLDFQSRLPLTVPYAVLKGTSAARYYPRPEYRIMGDIDLMTRREDMNQACRDLMAAGWREVTGEQMEASGRHRAFVFSGITVEMHERFAYQRDPEAAEWLDDQITAAIGPDHTLPDLLNGLTLLEHLNHHMESGIGLRQILDWMMFAHRCLDGRGWQEFRPLAERLGLVTLAKVCTRMCEIELGFPEHEWCADTDTELCRQLTDYVLECGNFGSKRERQSMIGEQFLSNARSLRGALVFLQRRGMMNWGMARRHPVLRPFAWAYQAVRYLRKGLSRNRAFGWLQDEYVLSRTRASLYEALGVTREGEIRTLYRDGTYRKG